MTVFPVNTPEYPFDTPVKDPATGKNIIGIPLAYVQDGYRLESLVEYFNAWRTRPDRRKGHIKLNDAESFINYINRFKNFDNTVILISRTWYGRKKVTAIFNYHPAGPDDNKTGFGDFTASVVVSDVQNILQLTNIPYFMGEIK